MLLSEIIYSDKKYYINMFGERLPIAFAEADGVKLSSSNGEKYYDFIGGIADSSLGCKFMPSCKNISAGAKLAELLCEASCFDKAFFYNSGIEANEGAFDFTKEYFYKKGIAKNEIIITSKSFDTSLYTNEKFVFANINDWEDLLSKVNDNTGAIMVELIQGESDLQPINSEYIKKIRKLSDEKDILFIVDEVKTSVGRFGTIFGYQSYDVEPDIITLSKGICESSSMGVLLTKRKFYAKESEKPSSLENQQAYTEGVCIISELTKNHVLYRSKKASEYFFEKLLKLEEEYDIIKNVRGKGLVIGIEFNKPICKEIIKKLYENKILVGTTGETTLRLFPPLIIKKDEVDYFITILKDILEEMK